MREKRRISGFTVTELTAVLGMFAIMSSIAIPNLLDWLPKHRLNNAARELFSDIHYTRQRTATVNMEYRIVFTVAAEQYKIERGDASVGSTWPGTQEGSVRNYTDSTGSYYNPGIEIVSVTDLNGNSITALEFEPMGSMTAAIITLQNQKGGTVEITTTMAGSVKM